MWTSRYRNHYYIHGYFDREECTVVFSPTGFGGESLGTRKSIHAAKIAATKHAKQSGATA